MTYLFLDTETTGVRSTDVVLQLAFEVFTHDIGRICGQNNYFAHEFQYEIHPEAAKINGLTVEKVASLGGGKALIQCHLEYLSDWSKFATFVGHNIDFDLRLLRQTCERYGVQFPETVNTICTKKAAQRAKIPARLGDLHRHLFGEDFEGAHDALADVKATARCFFELKRLGIL